LWTAALVMSKIVFDIIIYVRTYAGERWALNSQTDQKCGYYFEWSV
jgi:hypothetical protein